MSDRKPWERQPGETDAPAHVSGLSTGMSCG